MTDKQPSIREELKGELEELKRIRDEVRVKLHLAGQDLKDSWKDLEPRIEKLEQRAKSEGEHVADATTTLASDLKKALRDFRDRLTG